MKLKNKQLEPLIKKINYPMKKFADARTRDRFAKSLSEEYDNFIKNRQEIVKALAKKDKKGEPIVENDQYQFDPKNIDKLNKEITELLDEEVEINTTVTIPQVRVMIENSTNDFNMGETDAFDNFFEDEKAKK